VKLRNTIDNKTNDAKYEQQHSRIGWTKECAEQATWVGQG